MLSMLDSKLVASILLLASTLCRKLGLASPSVAEICEATGVAKSTAYDTLQALVGLLEGFKRQRGRPPTAAKQQDGDQLGELKSQVLDFLYEHPGAVVSGRSKRRYSDSFRTFVIKLWEQYDHLGLEAFARAIQVPQTTVQQWLRAGRLGLEREPSGNCDEPDTEPESILQRHDQAPDPHHKATEADGQPGPAPQGTVPDPDRAAPDPDRAAMIGTVTLAWQQWDNKKHGFSAFCKHLRRDLNIPFSVSTIRQILQEAGLRVPSRRRRPPDASVARKQFQSFFPGAIWQGDGTQLPVVINGQTFPVNVELVVDSNAAAVVGLHVSKAEDSQALIQAFDNGVETTGHQPLALVVDNKSSNHTEQVHQAIEPTELVPARPACPTDKAHVEGAFGLFAQQAPPICIQAHSTEEFAIEVAKIQVETWARLLNNSPRKDRGGRSRAQLYQQHPEVTEEELAAAREYIAYLQRRQQLADETARRRADPHLRRICDDFFDEHRLEDPRGVFRDRIASYPIWAVLSALGIFATKKLTGILPQTASAPYLLGIVRNLAQKTFGILSALYTISFRLAYRDAHLKGARQTRDQLLAQGLSPRQLVMEFLGRALDADRFIDRRFWLVSTGNVIARCPESQRQELLHLAARLIYARFALPYLERVMLFDQLVELSLPVA